MKGKIVSFYLRGNLFGIDIYQVKEVVRNVSFTPVSGAGPHIAGLVNMRGQIVTLFDINKIMGYEYDGYMLDTSCIILKTSPNRPDYAGFLIEKPGEVIDIQDEWCQLPPDNIGGTERRFIKELVKLQDGLIILIEPDRIISECMTCHMREE